MIVCLHQHRRVLYTTPEQASDLAQLLYEDDGRHRHMTNELMSMAMQKANMSKKQVNLFLSLHRTKPLPGVRCRTWCCCVEPWFTLTMLPSFSHVHASL